MDRNLADDVVDESATPDSKADQGSSTCSPPATFLPLWVIQLGNLTAASGDTAALAVDAARGDSTVAGGFSGTAELGNGPATSAGDLDIFISHFDSTGAVEWVKQFGGTDDEYVTNVATDGNGNIFMIGLYNDTIDFSGGALSNQELCGAGMFVAAFDSRGHYLWSLPFLQEYSEVDPGFRTRG